MRDTERFWWAQLHFALACSAAAVVAPFIVLNLVPWDNPFEPASDIQQSLVMAALLLILLLGLGIGLAISSVRERRRHRLRVAAWNGDEAAMPLANVRLDPALVPDVEQQPLELMWHASGSIAPMRALELVIASILTLLTTGIAGFALLVPFFATRVQRGRDVFYEPPPQPMSPLEILLRIEGAFALVALLIGLGFYLARVLPHLAGRPFGLIVTADGIEERTQMGSRVRMTWNEMRLLDVKGGSSSAKRRFNLYAPGKRIGWTEYTAYTTPPGTRYEPADVTANEMTMRQEALLGLIAARTGLAPRTFADALMSRPAPSVAAARSQYAVVLLICALLLVGSAAAVIYFPVAPWGWMNWAGVTSTCLAALSLVLASQWTIGNTPKSPEHATPPPARAPSLDSSTGAYLLMWRAPLRRQLRFIALGVLLAVNLLPGAWAVAQFGVLLLRSLQPDPFSGGPLPASRPIIMGFVLAVVGFMGVLLVLRTLVQATDYVRADSDGLITGRGRWVRLIPWSSIIDVSWGPGTGGQTTYIVKSSGDLLPVSWPSGARTIDAMPPHESTQSIGPAELAALVAAKLGQPIRVRE